MRVRGSIVSFVSLAAVSVLLLALATAVGQAPAGQRGAGAQAPAGRGAAAPAIPRASDGKPDFTGIWQVLDNSLNENIEPHPGSWGVRAGQGAIVDPVDGKIPYLPAALAKRQENYKNRAKDPVSRCYKPGVPRINYIPYPFQITQTPTWMVFTYEFVHNYRNIYLNGSQHLEGIDFYNGDSRARWEGDTLIVDVRNFNDDPDIPTWFDGTGNYHSDALRVEERYTLQGPDHMLYRATMTDPKVFSRPWTIEVLLYRHKERNYRIMEYECHFYKETMIRQGKGNYLKVVED